MRRGPLRVRLLLALAFAFILQAAFGSSWTIRGARPDLALVVTLVCCLFVGTRTASALGFVLGVLEASWSPRLMGSIIVSRTIVGWAVGLLEEVIFRDSVVVAVMVVAAGTLAAEGSFFLFAPQPHAPRWAIHTFTQAAFNGVLAVPVYYLIRKLIHKKQP